MSIITRPCAVCQVTIRVESLNHKYCGETCSALAQRRQLADDKKLPHSHEERHAVTDTQRAIQRKAVRK